MRYLLASLCTLFNLTSFSQVADTMKSQSVQDSERIMFIAKVDIANAVKNGISLDGYVVNIDYAQIKRLHGKTIKVTGKVTIVKGLNSQPKKFDKNGQEIRIAGYAEDTKQILSPKIEVIEQPKQANTQDKRVYVEFFMFHDDITLRQKIDKIQIEFSDSLSTNNNESTAPKLFIHTKNDSIYGFTAVYLGQEIKVDLSNDYRCPLTGVEVPTVIEVNFNDQGTSNCYDLFLWCTTKGGLRSLGPEGENCQNRHFIQYVKSH